MAVEDSDDLLKRSCPPCYHKQGRVSTNQPKPDTLTTLPGPWLGVAVGAAKSRLLSVLSAAEPVLIDTSHAGQRSWAQFQVASHYVEPRRSAGWRWLRCSPSLIFGRRKRGPRAHAAHHFDRAHASGGDRGQAERNAVLIEAAYSELCGAMHDDELTETFRYTRTQAGTLIPLVAGFVRDTSENL